jgi:hypothetical protein
MRTIGVAMGETVRVQEAALNNAEWCHVFCRSHGIVGCFDDAAWSSAERTPAFYPDAVTLVPGCSAETLISQVDATPGCSIKDSFADLDLSAYGFEALFTAEWLCQEQVRGRALSKGWSTVVAADELERWEAVWGEPPAPRPFFRSELLADERVKILARSNEGRFRAGAVANCSPGVIGLTNLFDVDGDLESVWSDSASAARAVWGRMPVVGYDTGKSLDAAHRAEFEPIGSIVVWVNRGHA